MTTYFFLPCSNVITLDIQLSKNKNAPSLPLGIRGSSQRILPSHLPSVKAVTETVDKPFLGYNPGKMKDEILVAVSGGFDPLHIGHVRMFREARALGNRLVVILNNDHWLRAKKGFVFMPEHERKEVLEALEHVDEVILTDHEPDDADRSVCRILKRIRPHIFANGGDRKPDGDPVPEVSLCEELGITLAYNVGHGGKVQSSSWLTKNIAQ